MHTEPFIGEKGLCRNLNVNPRCQYCSFSDSLYWLLCHLERLFGRNVDVTHVWGLWGRSNLVQVWKKKKMHHLRKRVMSNLLLDVASHLLTHTNCFRRCVDQLLSSLHDLRLSGGHSSPRDRYMMDMQYLTHNDQKPNIDTEYLYDLWELTGRQSPSFCHFQELRDRDRHRPQGHFGSLWKRKNRHNVTTV